MPAKPIVRYMLLCDDWQWDPANRRRVTIIGLITNIHSLAEPPYPLLYRQLCVFLALTEGRGQGEGKIVCRFPETGQQLFETPGRPIAFGRDPLRVVALGFRIKDISFPQSGLYTVQFWYDGEFVEERPLRMR
jgi:hypothetical protein